MSFPVVILSSYDGIPESVDVFANWGDAEDFLRERLSKDRFLEPLVGDDPYWFDGDDNPADLDSDEDYWTDGKVEIRWMESVEFHFPTPS